VKARDAAIYEKKATLALLRETRRVMGSELSS